MTCEFYPAYMGGFDILSFPAWLFAYWKSYQYQSNPAVYWIIPTLKFDVVSFQKWLLFHCILLPANEVWGKVMFLYLSVSHSVHSEAGGTHPTGMHTFMECHWKMTETTVILSFVPKCFTFFRDITCHYCSFGRCLFVYCYLLLHFNFRNATERQDVWTEEEKKQNRCAQWHPAFMLHFQRRQLQKNLWIRNLYRKSWLELKHLSFEHS